MSAQYLIAHCVNGWNLYFLCVVKSEIFKHAFKLDSQYSFNKIVLKIY